MSFESIISHMNGHHKENLVDLCKKYASVDEVSEVELKGVDFEGLDIVYNGGKDLRIPFPKKANEETLKDAIIELCSSVKKTLDKIQAELDKFKAGFGSVCLATQGANGVECTYAPLVQTQKGDYIYISEVADHYKSIKENPKNIEVLFVEDEEKAASMILRKRIRYRVEAEFLPRGAEFDAIYDEFERQNDSDGGIKMIRNMLDFHLVKLNYKEGSFVKGFGQAYKIHANGELEHVKGNNPHKPHGHGKAHGAGGHSHS
ncbi:HugZ family heme oxygenase [Campylobacter sp. MIT 99-7217]|uniref:HugZ family heme oxygenase n=1 Tax=Campylobacter sp. MIT 99-7217 TaxID=535091 RepID=UPI00115971D7|nr:HugZ family heme oxygenase [Campylobacter sp. MIT 99-7217]TQR32426.1 HugZ family heme oxygenase [Campylobacter sp. MIT 99-7217]